MGITIDGEWETPYGFKFTKTYANISQSGEKPITIQYSSFPGKVAVLACVHFYKDEEARRTVGVLPIHKEFVTTFVPYEELGNPFKHVYEELKKKYPIGVDVV